jgi:acyl-CoA thioesterase FadM
MRVFIGYLKYRYLEAPGPAAPLMTDGSLSVFSPSVHTVSTPLGDLDYTLHKSNSTYLADLDLARGRHFYGLFRVGLQKYGKQGTVFPALGAVTCMFKKEIRPFARVRIWTRVLAWDDKWIFLVSHFASDDGIVETGRSQESRAASLYATSISKQVVKRGRKTIPPVEFLASCGLVPSESVPSVNVSSNGATALDPINRRIEERRVRGLALAEHVAGLDEASVWFSEANDAPFAIY